MNNPTSTYVFDNAWHQEKARLDALANIWDPYTRRNLEALAPLDGLHCLEAGAGGGSIARWLCDRAGPEGRVVATDLDTRFIQAIQAPNLEARRHDIVHDVLEEGAYDLVHCRLLLGHLPAAEAALSKMVAALKPGGHLLVEEFDHVTFLPDPDAPAGDQAAWHAFLDAFARIAEQRGIDLIYGRRLLPLLQAQGLSGVRVEGSTTQERGGIAGRDLLRLSIVSMRPLLTDTGLMDDATVDRLLALLDSPNFTWTSQVMVAATGSKP